MKITIHGDHVKITDSMKSYIEEKLSKLSKFFGEDADVEAIVKVRIKGEEEIIEVTIPNKSLIVRAEESNKDFYTAVDVVQKKLESQIKKNKSKIASRYKDKTDFIFSDTDIESDNEDKVIIRRKEIEFKPMDEEEALLQMELLNHDFFVFKNIEERCTSVLYRRKDGSYGIINAR